MAFLIAIVAGAIVRLAYRGIVVFRKIFRHKMWVINVEDLFFWIATAIYLFVQIYHTSNGSIRWYLILGIVVGALVASFFIKKIEKMQKKIYVSSSKKKYENLAKKNKKSYDIYTKGE